MATLSRLTSEDVSSRYEALDAGQPGLLFTEYQAYDRVLERPALVRVLDTQWATPDLMDSLAHEMRRVSQISQPAVERVLDVLTVNKTLAIVLEPRRGSHLGERLEKVRAFPVAYTVDLAVSMVEALQAAHQAGVVHGDLQVNDVYLSAEGIVKICGIGIMPAVLSAPASARPLLLAGAPLPSPTTDIRSLGLILFQLLTGKPSATLEEAAAGPASASNRVPGALSNLVRCLVVAEERYASMTDVLRDLKSIQESIRAGHPMPAIGPPLPPSLPARRSRRKKGSEQSNGANHSKGGFDPPEGAIPVEMAAAARVDPASANGVARNLPGDEPEGRPEIIRRKIGDPVQIEEPAPVRRRRRGFWWGLFRAVAWLLFMILLPPAVAVGGFFYLNSLASTPEVTVPALRGKSREEAKKILDRLGLKMEVEPSNTFDQYIPPGGILRQIPEAAVHVKSPRTIRVFLSRGSRTVTVPLIEGKPCELAAQVVQNAGLHYKSNGDISSASVPYGQIVRQWPPSGRVVPRGTEMNVLVSAGPSEQQIEAASPDKYRSRTITIVVPKDKPQAGVSAAAGQVPTAPLQHRVEIHEVGPADEDRLLWQGSAAGGEKIERDITLEPYYDARVLLDGRPIQVQDKTAVNPAPDKEGPDGIMADAGGSSSL